MTSWHSYPSIFALGHRAIGELLLDPVTVEEKVDGSQFSFGLFEDGYKARSKGAQLEIHAPDKMFAKGVEIIQSLPLKLGWTYRGEYLQKPKHNALAYSRVPINHIILFDINTGHEEYLTWEQKAEEAARIGLEIVPLLHLGMIVDTMQFKELLDRESVLGGPKIEGVVVKNYARFGKDKKVLMGKFVSEAFKEIHSKEWKASNPGKADVIEMLKERYRTPARWQKAVQHLRETGSLEDSPRDIGALFREVPQDVEKECKEEIMEILYKWAWPQIQRGMTRGLPEWYKEQLLEKQFETSA